MSIIFEQLFLFDYEPHQRYEAYERKEEERRDLASDYLQVLSKSIFKHAKSLDNPLNDRQPWVPLSLKFLWTAQTQDQMIRWLSWQMPSKSKFSCSWRKNPWKVSFHTSINRRTSALMKWDFMLLKKCLKKVRLHAIEWWTVHNKFLPIAYMPLTHY